MPTLHTMPGTCSLSPDIAVAWLDRARMEANAGVRQALARQNMEPTG
jgi:hypothetical protein